MNVRDDITVKVRCNHDIIDSVKHFVNTDR